MIDLTIELDQTEEEMLTYEVSDEALESATGTGNEKAGISAPAPKVVHRGFCKTERPPRGGLSEFRSGAIKSVSPGRLTGRCKPRA